jgi:hypothetical protein
MIEKTVNLFEKFKNSCLDTSAVGLTVGSEYSYYGATPEGARVIAWAEIHGIHFCHKPDSDGIYVVNPDASKNEAVRLVAKDFPEFLGLVVACNHASILWQAQAMTRAQFNAYLDAHKPSMKQRSVLRAIQNIYHPPTVADPYSYIKNLK